MTEQELKEAEADLERSDAGPAAKVIGRRLIATIRQQEARIGRLEAAGKVALAYLLSFDQSSMEGQRLWNASIDQLRAALKDEY